MRRPTILLCTILGLSAAGGSAAAPRAEPAAQGEPAGESAGESAPVLRVGGEEVDAREYGRWLIDTYGARLAREYAQDWVVEREAQRLGITVDPEDVVAVREAEIRTRITHAFLGREEDWLAELSRTGRTPGGLRRQRFVELEPDVLASAIVARDRVVPEEKIQREWELRYGRNGRRYDLSMMRFGVVHRTAPSETSAGERKELRRAALEARRADALAARARLVAGEDFGDLAAELSDDALTRENRGRLPLGFSHPGWPDEFLDGLEALEAGDLSEPLWGRGGWWLVYVHSVRVTTLAEVRAALEAELLERGPEQDEIGRLRAQLGEDVDVRVQPTLYAEQAASDEAPGDVVAMTIDGQPIPRKTYALWLLHVRGEASAHHFVEHWVVEREAERRGLFVTPEEAAERAREYIERMILASHEGSREAWLTHLKMSGREEDTFFRDLTVRMRIELLSERLYLQDLVVTPEMVRREWEETYGRGGRAVEARMILLRVSLPAPDPGLDRQALHALVEAESQAVRARAEELARRVRNGEDFATLARKHSEEPTTAADGGRLQGRFRPETWPEHVARVVQGLAPGACSDPLDLGTAWVVFQVLSVREVAFEDVSEDLERVLRERRPPFSELAAYRNSLMQTLPIEVLPAMYE